MATESNEQLCSLERTSNLVVVQAEQLPSQNETKLSTEYTCAEQAEHQYMATGNDEPVCSQGRPPSPDLDQAEQLSGHGNGPGMTKKAASVYKLTVRERAEPLCDAETKSRSRDDQSEQKSGRVNKLSVRERKVKSNSRAVGERVEQVCSAVARPRSEADQAEQYGHGNGPGKTEKATNVYKLSVRERDVYELSVRERAEPKCCAEEMPKDVNYQAGQESNRAKQLRDAGRSQQYLGQTGQI